MLTHDKTEWSEDHLIIFTLMKVGFSKSCHNFSSGLFLGLILLPECIVLSDLLWLMYALAIFFWTIPGIYVVNLDRFFFAILGRMVF